MAKSLRSKKEKRLRAIRREIVDPYYQRKDEAKMAALEAAMAAPKLPAATPASTSTSTMKLDDEQVTVSTNLNGMDVEMEENDQGKVKASLKPLGGVGKKSKKKLKLGKKNRRGKGKIRGKRNL